MSDRPLYFARSRDGGIVASVDTDEYDDRDERVRETVFTLSKSEADALVVEHLRGPMGPVGPTGATGASGGSGRSGAF